MCLEGKVRLITAGGAGIGSATGVEFAQHRADVVIHGLASDLV
jgi:NAD(P)-dependent dehydrogenase (short-subunit alcohol dehydrogenase family)